ncbi:MAG: hypothetical protein M9964_06235 [Solirubrobacterales bacterium]|nr:hypothetical protein [Solirubrobacterales bacterium]
MRVISEQSGTSLQARDERDGTLVAAQDVDQDRGVEKPLYLSHRVATAPLTRSVIGANRVDVLLAAREVGRAAGGLCKRRSHGAETRSGGVGIEVAIDGVANQR